MKVRGYYIIIIAMIYFFIVGCSSTRHLPPNEKLYTGANINVTGTSTVREQKVLTEDLGGLTRPKPNTKLLGLRLKLSIYNLFRNKKENSFFGKIRSKNGEPPVLLSQIDLQQNVRVLQSHMENKGYFQSKVAGDTIVRRKKAHARYNVIAGDQYKIAAVQFQQLSEAAKKLYYYRENPLILMLSKPNVSGSMHT